MVPPLILHSSILFSTKTTDVPNFRAVKIQKAAVRIIENLPSRAHAAEYLKSNAILPFDLIIKFNIAKGDYPRMRAHDFKYLPALILSIFFQSVKGYHLSLLY